MRKKIQCSTWVVYRKTAIILKKPIEVNVVCEQGEWEELQRKKPNQHALVRGGIATEAEADKLARGTSGNAVRPGERATLRSFALKKLLESSPDKTSDL